MGDTEAPSWYTREETARILERSVKTVDRLRKTGVLVDLDTKGMVRISRASIEEYLRRPVEVRVDPAGIVTIEQAHYDNLLRQLHHYQAEAEHSAAIVQELEARRAECERLNMQIRVMLADQANPLMLVRNLWGRQLVLVKNNPGRGRQS